MSTLSVINKDPAVLSGDVLVLLGHLVDGAPRILHSSTRDKLVRDISRQVEILNPRFKPGSVIHVVPSVGKVRRVAVVGLGDCALPSATDIRDAAAVALRDLVANSPAESQPASITIDFSVPDAEHLHSTALGALLGSYRYDHSGDDSTPPSPALILRSTLPTKQANAILDRAQTIATAVNDTRDLVNTPPNLLYPEKFAQIVIGRIKGTKVKAEVLGPDRLAKEGFGGILAVGQGSTRGPQLVKMSYRPRKSQKHIALVGKGITFDSGGLSLKPAKSMETMKSDMAGAAAVFHAVLAAEALQLPIAVTGWLCLAENMPSGAAQRPSDVITMKNGTTVEVLNTDAEGRLVLGDGLVVAAEENPDLLVDVATLTGAQMVALGTRVSAVMGTDDARSQVVAAAERAGEDMWPMPLPKELRASLKSKVADLANIGDRFGGMLVAGLFLQEFVGEVPWAHLDIAGPSFNESQPYADTPAGGTGSAVRTLIELLESSSK